MPFPSVLCLLSVYSFCFRIKLSSSSYHQLWYILYMFCKTICSVQLPALTISIQASYKWAFAGSGTFQILPPVSDHQIRAYIFPDDFPAQFLSLDGIHTIRSHKNDRTIVPSQIPSSVPHDRMLYSYLRSQDDIPGSSGL